MNRPLTIVLLVAAIVIQTLFALPSAERDSNADEYKLPADLLIGAGLSAVQTEGAWDVDGKAESSVDWVLNTMKMDPNHKVAANSYNRFREDVKMAAELKLDLYKFSISWARVLPTADADAPNAAGVTFYNNLIDEIIAKGMTPMVTMYHFDHPRILEDKFKGWQDKQMADKFAEYAGFLFKTFGDRVKHWVTINEPNMYCAYFTNMYVQAGLRKREEVDQYECIHNNILAHLKARQVFKRGSYDGKLGYSTLLMYAQPATISPEDVYAANVFNELHAGSSLHPVVYGDYPQVYKNLVGKKLKEFEPSEKQELAGSADFIGLNIYFGMVASFNRFNNASAGDGTSMFLGQLGEAIPFIDISLNGGALGAFTTIEPNVMRNALLWTHEKYNISIVITENGYGDMLGLGVHDNQRGAYHSAFLRTLVSTVKQYNVSVLAYSAWSLIDSFEFKGGYRRPFGLIHIDYASGTLDRSHKDSSSFWIKMRETNSVPFVEPDKATTLSLPTTALSTSTQAPSTAAPSSSTCTRSSMTVILLAVLGLMGALPRSSM